MDEVPEPFLFFCTDVSNPTVKGLSYVEDHPEDLKWLQENPLVTRVVRCTNHNPDILEICKDHRRAYVFDEIGNLFDLATMKKLVAYMREVGYKDEGLQVWATSQRAAADVWPAVYVACRRIRWVGPLHDEKAIRTLFSHRSEDLDYQTFKKNLANLKKFDWKNPNWAESILTVKNI
ncbi:MAG: hypothetical protein ACREL1_00345 [bacterium]